jgi:hypothetical protein
MPPLRHGAFPWVASVKFWMQAFKRRRFSV